jgi:hypothetical protein
MIKATLRLKKVLSTARVALFAIVDRRFDYTLRDFSRKRDGMQNHTLTGRRLGRQALLFPFVWSCTNSQPISPTI